MTPAPALTADELACAGGRAQNTENQDWVAGKRAGWTLSIAASPSRQGRNDRLRRLQVQLTVIAKVPTCHGFLLDSRGRARALGNATITIMVIAEELQSAPGCVPGNPGSRAGNGKDGRFQSAPRRGLLGHGPA